MKTSASASSRPSAALLALVLGCEPEHAPTPAPPIPAVEDAAPSIPVAADEFPTIEQLADWPVENVDPKAWFGWRIEASGEFSHSNALRFTTEPNAYVLAIADGRVRTTEVRADGTTEVIIDHAGGIESRYAPLGTSLVYGGLPVVRGVVVGLVVGSELALEVRVRDVPIDPLLVLRSGMPAVD